MKLKNILLFTFFLSFTANAQSPYLLSSDGKYLGNLNDNPYDLNSVANPYGKYGSEYSLHSVNNPYGAYGSEYSLKSPNNPYATSKAPKIYSTDSTYLGVLSRNSADLESTENEYGTYGSSYSLNSINNPDGIYGSEYSQKSATFLYGNSFFEKQQNERRSLATYRPTIQPFFDEGELPAANEWLINRNKYLYKKLKEEKNIQGTSRFSANRETRPFDHNYQEVEKIINKNIAELQKFRQLGMSGSLMNYKVPENDYINIPKTMRPITKELVEQKIEEAKEIFLNDNSEKK